MLPELYFSEDEGNVRGDTAASQGPNDDQDVSLFNNSAIPRDIRAEVFKYYSSFDDSSPAVYKGDILFPEPTEQCMSFFEECLLSRHSRGVTIRQYNVLRASLEAYANACGGPVPDLVRLYPSGEAFVKAVENYRRKIVQDQKWNKAKIKLKGIEHCGYFIDLLDSADDMIADGGGVSELKPFAQKRDRSGARLFSHPLNCNGIEEHEAHLLPGVPPCYVSIYCDATVVSGSGSQDCTVLRMRIENGNGKESDWKDIGLIPKLDLNNLKSPKAHHTSLRMELFQRFMFLVFRKTAALSYDETRKKGYQIRLFSIICDQPQERQFLSLFRSVKTDRICSHCRFSFKTGSGYGEIRDPVRTVSAQLDAAILERMKDAGWKELPSPRWKLMRTYSNTYRNRLLRELKDYLGNESAHQMPPALAVLPGMLKCPGSLYYLPGFDRLHVLDLGITRLYLDKLYEMLDDISIRGSNYRGTLIDIANNRISALSPSSGVRALRPFISSSKESRANFTGKQVRSVVPFLWFAVIGLNSRDVPDNDPIYITALMLDFFYSVVCGVNKESSYSLMTEEDISVIGVCADQLVKMFEKLIGPSANTKLNRVQAHCAENFRRFGPPSVTDTAHNESLHKGIKGSYKSTNRRQRLISQQILKINLAAELLRESGTSRTETTGHLKFPSNSPLRTSELNAFIPSNFQTRQAIIEQETSAKYIAESLLKAQREKKANSDIQDFYVALSTGCKAGHSNNLFDVLHKATIAANIEWIRQEEVYIRQTIYAGSNFANWGARHDSIYFKSDFENVVCNLQSDLHIGMLFMLLRLHKSTINEERRPPHVAVVIKMENISPQIGNKRIVEDFKFKRLCFQRDQDDVKLTVVPFHKIVRRVEVVPDIYYYMKSPIRSNLNQFELPTYYYADTPEKRLDSKFFVVKHHKLTVTN